MNKKLIISLLLVVSLFFVVGCTITPTITPTCPSFCDDEEGGYDSCTNDFCSEETGYACKHEYIVGCCNYKHNCPDNTPYCKHNKCYEKECESDDDCTETEVYVGDDYLGTEVCVSGKCVECRTDKDCYICPNKWHCGFYVCNEYGSCTKCKFDRECRSHYNRYCTILGFCT